MKPTKDDDPFTGCYLLQWKPEELSMALAFNLYIQKHVPFKDSPTRLWFMSWYIFMFFSNADTLTRS